jgi:5-methylcytosine-specific restriction protein A
LAQKPGRPCSVPGCPNLAVEKGRCEEHAYPVWGGRERATAAQRGYDWEWQKIRERVLREEPYCRWCGKPSTTVDHIVPKARGGTDTRSNLQALCGRCRKIKDARDAAEGKRRKRKESEGYTP